MKLQWRQAQLRGAWQAAVADAVRRHVILAVVCRYEVEFHACVESASLEADTCHNVVERVRSCFLRVISWTMSSDQTT